MSETKLLNEAWNEWFSSYGGSIDTTAMRMAFEAGARFATLSAPAPDPADVAEVNAAMSRVEEAADHPMPVGMGSGMGSGMGMMCRDAKILAAEVRRLRAEIEAMRGGEVVALRRAAETLDAMRTRPISTYAPATLKAVADECRAALTGKG